MHTRPKHDLPLRYTSGKGEADRPGPAPEELINQLLRSLCDHVLDE